MSHRQFWVGCMHLSLSFSSPLTRFSPLSPGIIHGMQRRTHALIQLILTIPSYVQRFILSSNIEVEQMPRASIRIFL
ncbi:hypothetical protein BGW80DRAFT_1269267 [Lactifluus volemus]|nr:hypothetical protein BGW80DRAFT_1269267 [Lactifluus volemus]